MITQFYSHTMLIILSIVLQSKTQLILYWKEYKGKVLVVCALGKSELETFPGLTT